jgi:hypothetical protein
MKNIKNKMTAIIIRRAPTMFGVLPAAATGTFTLAANFGLAFDGAYTASHSMVFMFQLN